MFCVGTHVDGHMAVCCVLWGWGNVCQRLQKDKRRRLVTLKLVMQQLLEALDTAHATGIGALLSRVSGCILGCEELPCVGRRHVLGSIALCSGCYACRIG
jgi:hypothetical protein